MMVLTLKLYQVLSNDVFYLNRFEWGTCTKYLHSSQTTPHFRGAPLPPPPPQYTPIAWRPPKTPQFTPIRGHLPPKDFLF